MKAAPLLACGVVAALLLSGCAPVGSASEVVEPSATAVLAEPPTFPGIRVLEDLDYGAGGPGVFLDVCLPTDDAPPAPGPDEPDTSQPRPAMLLVHGGSWRQGDKASPYWRSACRWLASEGFVTFAANYRLAPSAPFPAAIDDLRSAVSWIRSENQVERFDIDPGRLGALGGSAGGNLVALLGLDDVSTPRMRAIVDLSGPIDLSAAGLTLGTPAPGFPGVQLDYLGCDSYDDCPQATDASPLYAVDETDPPFFVVHSTDEFVPIEQSDALVEELRDSDVDTTYVTVEGTLHSIAILDDELRARIGVWLRGRLA